MPTIKGPIKIGPKFDNSEFINKLKEQNVEVKLPFSATGFSSTKTPIEKSMMKGIEFADDKYDLNKDGVVDEKDVSLAAEVLAKSKKNTSKKSAKKSKK